jgi:ubiquinone biosynthesis protein
MKLSLIYKHKDYLHRFAEIVKVLSKYGLADWMKRIELEDVKKFFTSSDGQAISELSFERRIRLALTELGTTFIKLGQILSTRGDLIGPELATELSELQENTPANRLADVRQTIEEELNKTPEELFAEFEPEALASASIGQVHRATLHDGSQVVVKIQHRGVEDRVNRDLDILEMLAHLAENHSRELRAFRPRATVGEFRRTLLRELDYRKEQRNLQEFARNFKEDETVRFPAVYPELSARRVLTMGFLPGVGVGKTERLKEEGHDLKEIARRGANVFLGMVFRDGFYHADPHPGNIFVMAGEVLGILDCGMVSRLEEDAREAFTTALLAAITGDTNRLIEVITHLAVVPEDLDRDAFRAEVHDFLIDYTNQSLNEFDVSGALNGIISIIRRYHIILPSTLSLFLRFLVVLEGTARLLDPDFSLAEMMQPYYTQVLREQYSPQRILRKIRRAYSDWDQLFTIFPGDFADVLDRIKRGRFEVRLDHRRLQASIQLLVEGILTASLFLGSSLLLSFKVSPTLGEVSVMGLVGLLTSVFLGVRLFRATKRHRDEL